MEDAEKLLGRKRQKFILDLIERNRGVMTTDLAVQLGVSLSTIRRDLGWMGKKGLIVKTHGGAIPLSFGMTDEHPYHLKSTLQDPEKAGIGRKAATLIKDGDTVIFDSGSTTFRIAHEVRERRFSAIALDLPVAMELADSPLVDLIVLGGKVRTGIYSIVGNFAEEILKKLNVNKFFLGADAIHMERGVTNATLAEVPLKQTSMKIAQEVILVADSSKFGVISLVHVCRLRDIRKIITDRNLPAETRRRLEDMDIEVIIAE
jgi:DeoR family transcriptional regulator, fructose operon transcriptional repressor